MSPRWLHWPASWSPSDLADLRAWYDADDSSTIYDATTGGSLPSSGNDVARWEDKSGGGYHVTQGTAANCPHYVTNTLNGKPVIECTSQWLTAATASDWTFLHSAESTVAIVFQAGTVADPNAVYAILGNVAASQATNGFSIAWDDRASLSRNERLLHNVTRGSSPNNVNNVSGNDAFDANTYGVLVVLSDPAAATAADRSSFHVNGGTPISNNALTGTAATGSATHPIDIGADGQGLAPLTGGFAELVFCDALLSQSDREKLEGYLAHKWGLTANLPSTHPYKSTAP